jgi:hypothetical protein
VGAPLAAVTSFNPQAIDLWLTEIIPLVGDPARVSLVSKKWRALQESSYRFILAALIKNKTLAAFTAQIQPMIPEGQHKAVVQKIYALVVRASPCHKWFRQHSANPLALAPLVEHAESAHQELLDASAKKEKETAQIRATSQKIVIYRPCLAGQTPVNELRVSLTSEKIAKVDDGFKVKKDRVFARLKDRALLPAGKDPNAWLPAVILCTRVVDNHFQKRSR